MLWHDEAPLVHAEQQRRRLGRGPEARYGLAAARDHDLYTGGHVLDQLREVCLGLVYFNGLSYEI